YVRVVNNDMYHDKMERLWDDGFRNFLSMWHETSSSRRGALMFDKPQWILSPQQPDWKSCGVLTIARVYSCLNSSEFQYQGITPADISVMRLRILWILTVHLVERSVHREGEIAARKTHKQLWENLSNGKEVPW
ncbi:hypothetical protein PHMEG_0003073, partial [Phytophthora megakarya]